MRSLLRPFRSLAPILAVCAPLATTMAADLLPHEARYTVRLGTSANGPQIGGAVQRLSTDCRVRRLRREVSTEFALTPALRFVTESKLDGTETRGGGAFEYRLERRNNDKVESLSGKVTAGKTGVRADIQFPGRPFAFDLPVGTLLPVTGIARIVDRLKAGATAFNFIVFDPELTSDALTVDVGLASPEMLRPPRPDGAAAKIPAGAAWPVSIAFTPTRKGGQPLFVLSTMMHESGILDRVSVTAGIFALGADLTDLRIEPVPNCPTS